MTIKIRHAQQDDENANHWYFQVYGPDSIDGTVRIGIVDETGLIPEDWLIANLSQAQALIDNGLGDIPFTIKAEAKIFLENNPAAKGLIDLPPNDLELAITNRTAGQETLLLKALSYAVRFLYASLEED